MIVFVISLTLLLCGCQEQTETENNNLDKDVELDSDVVEFVYSNLTQQIDNGEVINVEVQYLFRNIAGRTININVSAEFYDQEDNLIYKSNSDDKVFKGFFANTTEKAVFPLSDWNVISYTGIDADKINHVKIIVKEIKL
jgi:hypothetical protein